MAIPSDALTRRQAMGRLGGLGLLLAGGTGLLGACGSDGSRSTRPAPGSSSGASSQPPNVLLIVADDMRYDQLPYLPNVQRLLVEQGVTFTQARCNVALCQPSRVGLHTGQMSRDNNEVRVGFGGTELSDHDNCLGAWMSGAGYRCGAFGKYVNGVDGKGGIDAPKGYETWREIIDHVDGYDFRVHLETGVQRKTGQFSTDYLAEEVLGFIGGGGPFMAIVAPTQAHAPFFPRADLADRFLDLSIDIVDEVDVSDKPPWIQRLAPLTEADKEVLRTEAIGSLQELTAVDDMLGSIVEGMDPDVLAETVIIFTSDNGVYRGEHRRLGADGKSGPYEVALHVPMVVRGPGFAPGPDVTVPSLAFQDITATILGVAGAEAGLPEQAGTSLALLAADASTHRDRVLLHEIGQGALVKTGDGVTTGPDHPLGFRKLFRYQGVRNKPVLPFVYECYDLDTDPDELSNWADDPARRAERDRLEELLVEALES